MKDTVILVRQAGLGSVPPGDAPFGVEMLDNFFHALEQLPEKPAAVCFYTEGVKLLDPAAETAVGLKLLERLGVRILACGTCLDHYGIGPELSAGRRSTMTEIVQLLSAAENVISV